MQIHFVGPLTALQELDEALQELSLLATYPPAREVPTDVDDVEDYRGFEVVMTVKDSDGGDVSAAARADVRERIDGLMRRWAGMSAQTVDEDD